VNRYAGIRVVKDDDDDDDYPFVNICTGIRMAKEKPSPVA
jgi:hypothetical protein